MRSQQQRAIEDWRSDSKIKQSRAKQLKANGYLTKPYLDRVLVETVQKCLQQVPKA